MVVRLSIISRILFQIILCVLFSTLIIDFTCNAQETDEITAYYWSKAKTAYEKNSISNIQSPFQLIVTTHYKHVDKHGVISKIDSATVKYFFSGSTIDSQQVLSGDNSLFKDITLIDDQMFDTNYYQFPYPNDTGGVNIAIGFDSDSTIVLPDGFMLIDRKSYYLRWLYMYYSAKKNYKRFSRSFRFNEVDSYIYPDSIWEVGTREGLLSLENFRIESKVDSIILSK